MEGMQSMQSIFKKIRSLFIFGIIIFVPFLLSQSSPRFFRYSYGFLISPGFYQFFKKIGFRLMIGVCGASSVSFFDLVRLAYSEHVTFSYTPSSGCLTLGIIAVFLGRHWE